MISQMTDRIDKPKAILLLELAASLEFELWSQQRDVNCDFSITLSNTPTKKVLIYYLQ